MGRKKHTVFQTTVAWVVPKAEEKEAEKKENKIKPQALQPGDRWTQPI